jgi:hypothetical protein
MSLLNNDSSSATFFQSKYQPETALRAPARGSAGDAEKADAAATQAERMATCCNHGRKFKITKIIM